MGWLFTHRPAGMSDREWFQKECVGDSGEILECATVRMVFYAAVRDKRDDKVWALICLTQRRPNREYYNYGWKSMSEDAGPYDTFAPARVLSLLSPTDSEYALKWREACRQNIAQAELARMVKPETQLEFSHPIRFTNGNELTRFTFMRRSLLRGSDGGLYRVPDWRRRSFTILQPA